MKDSLQNFEKPKPVDEALVDGKENVKIAKFSPARAKDGKFLKGSGGRLPGHLNYDGKLKKQILTSYVRAGGPERFEREVKEGDVQTFVKLTNVVASLLPKESMVEVTTDMGPKMLIIREVEKKDESKVIDIKKEGPNANTA